MPGTTKTTWTGQAGTDNFNDPLHWSAGVPSAATDAEIDGTSASPLTISLARGTDAVRSLTITFATLHLCGGTLSIALASSLDALNQSGGLLLFQNQGTAATSILTGPVTQTAGTLEVDAGTLDLQNPNALAGAIAGSGILVNSGTLAVDGLTVGGSAAFENQGTATLAGGDLILGDNATSTAVLLNDAGAVFDITADGAVLGGVIDGRPDVLIDNAGVFDKTGGTGTSVVDAVLEGSGTIFATSGNLTLAGGGYGSATIGKNATLELAAPFAGSVTFAANGGSTLALDAPGDFIGTMNEFANGDTIDFRNTHVGNAALSGSMLLVTVGSATETFDLRTRPSGNALVIQTDAAGTGSDVIASNVSFAPASALVNTHAPIDFGKQHPGATPHVALSVTNAAAPPAERLDATISATGSATASGSIDLLAAAQTDTTDLIVGLSTAIAGVANGSVVLGFTSDGTGTCGGGLTTLPSQTLAVSGTVYALAAAMLTAPTGVIVHVGEPGAASLTVRNTAAANGFSEGLRAFAEGANGGLSLSGATGLVAAGSSDDTSLNIGFATAAAGIVSGTLTVDLKSDGTGTSGLGTSDLGDATVPFSATVDNHAVAAIEKTSGSGGLSQIGNVFFLDFGTLAFGSSPLSANLDVRNIAVGPADLLGGAFAQSSAGAFGNSGFVTFSGLGAGMAGAASSITFTPDAVGALSETISLRPTGSNASGFYETLPEESLIVSGTVSAGLAVPGVNTESPIDFGPARIGTALGQALSVSNLAPSPAQSLDVTASAGGAATVSGSITGLAPGDTDASSIVAGISTGTAGVAHGDVTLAFSSDNGSGTVTPLPGDNADIAITGTIFNEASFAASPPAPVILHLGDAGNGAISVDNTAPAPFSENLVAHILATAGGVSTDTSGTGPIAPQASAGIPYMIDTSEAGTIDGSIALAFDSDGTGIDNAGPTEIGTDTVAVNATVNNFATAALTASSGVLTRDGNNFLLDLGTTTVGSTARTVDLSVLNTAVGPADLLSGTLPVTGNDGFTNAGSGSFSNIEAGTSADVQQLSLDPTTAGSFTETLLLHSTGSNAGGFSGALPDATVTVEETVQPAPGFFATVLGAGGTTVTIPFTTAANAAAAQVALNGISNAVLAEALTQVDYTGSLVFPGVNTPRIGLVVLGTSSVPLAPFALGNNIVSAVLNGAAQQVVTTGIAGNSTVVAGPGGAVVGNLGTNNEVFFGGGGDQTFTQVDLTSIGIIPSAEVWLDGNATFDDSVGRTLIHIGTVTGGAGDVATTLTVTDNGTGRTTVDIDSNSSEAVALPDIINFAGSSSVATTVNAAGGAGGLGAPTGGVELMAFVGTGSGFINGNGSKVVLFGGSTGAVTLLGGAGTDIDAGAGGLIEAGSGGGGMLFSSTVAGSTTLIGGGEGDLLASVGRNTVMVAGRGNESLYSFQPSRFEGFAGAQAPGATTLFQAETGGNTYLPGSGQTSIASVADSNGGNLFQEGASGSGNSATIRGFISGVDSISGVNFAGGNYALITSGSPGPQTMLLSVNGAASTLTFGDGTTWTFNSTVRGSDFINVASQGGV